MAPDEFSCSCPRIGLRRWNVPGVTEVHPEHPADFIGIDECVQQVAPATAAVVRLHLDLPGCPQDLQARPVVAGHDDPASDGGRLAIRDSTPANVSRTWLPDDALAQLLQELLNPISILWQCHGHPFVRFRSG